MYFKTIENGFIIAITTGIGHVPITEEEYQTILDLVKHTPEAPVGYWYKLRDESFEWELVEAEPEPPLPEDISDKEALSILLGGESE